MKKSLFLVIIFLFVNLYAAEPQVIRGKIKPIHISYPVTFSQLLSSQDLDNHYYLTGVSDDDQIYKSLSVEDGVKVVRIVSL